MALKKTIETNAGIAAVDAYLKVFRFEGRFAGIKTIQVPTGEKDKDGKDVLADVAVPNNTAEVQVLAYKDKAKADADGTPAKVFDRFNLDLAEVSDDVVAAALADVGTITGVQDVFDLVKGVIYRSLKKRDEFKDATDV